MDNGLKWIKLLILVPEVLSGRITKDELLDEMVKFGLTDEEKNELLKRVENATIHNTRPDRQAD